MINTYSTAMIALSSRMGEVGGSKTLEVVAEAVGEHGAPVYRVCFEGGLAERASQDLKDGTIFTFRGAVWPYEGGELKLFALRYTVVG